MDASRSVVNREDRAVLVNLSDQEFYSNLATLGSYAVPARAAGERYAQMTIFGRWELYDLGDDRKGEKYWTASEIARSVLAEHNPDADLRRFGVFLCAGDHPTEAELAAAQAQQDAFYLEQIQQADLTYSRTPQRPDSITDVQRRAARALGIDRPWLVKLTAMSDCPACGGAVKAGAAVCRHCGAILDDEKAAKFGIVRPASSARTPADAHAADAGIATADSPAFIPKASAQEPEAVGSSWPGRLGRKR